jgi:hypothetical protein
LRPRHQEDTRIGKDGRARAVVDIMFPITSPELMLRLHHAEARERHAAAPARRSGAYTAGGAARRLFALVRGLAPTRTRVARPVCATAAAAPCGPAALAC